MASNDVEVLDPQTPDESPRNSEAGSELNRRNFLALGIAGAAAGAALLSSNTAQAQQPSNPAGYAEVDVLNLLLNVKYLKATFYSYVTQGADLPPESNVTLGTGGVFNAPGQVTFSSQQITDLFNEMYYDDLNQLIALRALQGVAVIPRPTMNLRGVGPSGSVTGLPAKTTLTEAQAISMAQFLEDLSVTAFTNASSYLTGTNLDYAMQAMATDGLHSGAIRLLAIQTGAPYNYTGSEDASITAAAIANSNTIYTFLGSPPELQPGFQITTSATVAISGDKNSGPPANTTQPSQPGISGPATVTAIPAVIPASYQIPYTTGNHHTNVIPGVSAADAANYAIGMPVYDSSNKWPNPGTYITSIDLQSNGTYNVVVSASSGGNGPGHIFIGTSAVTISEPFPSTGAFTVSTIGLITADPDAVAPADIGPGVATTGPALNPPGSAPSVLNQGFFATAGAGSSGTPPGLAFARSFQQVLAVLYDYSPANPTPTQTYEGGFYPMGAGGNITSVI